MSRHRLRVQLLCATLPSVLRLIAEHYWFVVWDRGECHRWEVWQTKNAGGRSIGHVHCDLKPHDAHVGGGPSRVVAEWTGAEAGFVINAPAFLVTAGDECPSWGRYRSSSSLL